MPLSRGRTGPGIRSAAAAVKLRREKPQSRQEATYAAALCVSTAAGVQPVAGVAVVDHGPKQGTPGQQVGHFVLVAEVEEGLNAPPVTSSAESAEEP
jgi:hypothetical protein